MRRSSGEVATTRNNATSVAAPSSTRFLSNQGRDVKACAVLHKGKKIYMGNLPFDVQHETLAQRVKSVCQETFGEVDYVRVSHSNDGLGRKRRAKASDAAKLNEGFCFVRFKEESAAERAIRELSVEDKCKEVGLYFEGRGQLKVEWAKEIHSEDVDQAALQAKAEAKKKKNEHKHRQRRRQKEREIQDIQGILEKVPEPAGLGATELFKDLNECESFMQSDSSPSEWPLEGTHPALDLSTFVIDWSQFPIDCDPGAGEWYGSKDQDHVNRRRERKRKQVQSFALVLTKLLGAVSKSKKLKLENGGGGGGGSGRGLALAPSIRVVDFGSGSGALCLPLAFLFPQVQFHAVDMKQRAVSLLEEKAGKSGLRNLTASSNMIEDFDESFDIALALHACGNATDFSMLQAIKNRAAFALCPCCVGKLKFSIQGGSSFSAKHKTYLDLAEGGETKGANDKILPDSLEHPRSEWMRRNITQDEFALIAKAGDISHGCEQEHNKEHGYDSLARTCKANIEFDRCLSAKESNYKTGLFKLINSGLTAKAEIILGIPDSDAWKDLDLNM